MMCGLAVSFGVGMLSGCSNEAAGNSRRAEETIIGHVVQVVDTAWLDATKDRMVFFYGCDEPTEVVTSSYLPYGQRTPHKAYLQAAGRAAPARRGVCPQRAEPAGAAEAAAPPSETPGPPR